MMLKKNRRLKLKPWKPGLTLPQVWMKHRQIPSQVHQHDMIALDDVESEEVQVLQQAAVTQQPMAASGWVDVTYLTFLGTFFR